MHTETNLVPLLFFASMFAFPLLRRHLIHRHQMERLTVERSPAQPFRETPVSTDDAPALALRLPEPHRRYALALLCRLQDAPYDQLDGRRQFLLRQARLDYMPATLHAYLNLTPSARAQLQERGQSPEGHLHDQLSAITQGISEALGLDHTAARHLLDQGQFLHERFGDQPATVRESRQS